MKNLREIYADVRAERGQRSTDKHRGYRQHLSLYEIILEPYRESAQKVFEIGVNRGGSILAWRDFFQNATIYGFDIRNAALETIRKQPRIVAMKVDQGDFDDLAKIAACGPFDVGIEDGSHIWAHQIRTFEQLWPAIAPGGLYIIEDTVTSYHNWIHTEGKTRESDYERGGVSCVEYFKNLVDHINFDGNNWDAMPFEQYTEFQRTIDWISFRTNSIFIRKRVTDGDPWGQ